MAEENKTIDETQLSETFEKLSQLPTENITDKNREDTEKLFSQIVESVKNGHQVTFAEYIALEKFGKDYDLKSVLSQLNKEQRQDLPALNNQIKEVSTRMAETKQKAIDNFVEGFPTKGSDKDNRPKIREKVAALNATLANTTGSFTAEQIQTLQDTINKHKKTNSKINIDKMFTDITTPEKGKSTATPTFTTLYNQLTTTTQAPIANDFATRLQNVSQELLKEEQEQILNAQNSTNEGQTTEPQAPSTPENSTEEQTPPTPEPQPQQTEPEITVTADEITKYMDEIANSENLDAFLADFPSLNRFEIDACMDIGRTFTEENDETKETFSPEASAIAFGSPINILKAYNYYKKDADKLDELDEIAAAFLKENASLSPAEAPDKAFALLALADKIKSKDEDLYNNVTSSLAKSLKAYDTEKFGTLSDDELHKNYEDLKKALHELPHEDVALIMKDYTFTDNKGKPLTGKKLEKVQADVVELARALTAQDLTATGVPQDKSLLLKRMDEIISTQILNKGISDELVDASKLLAQTQQEQYNAELENAKTKLTAKDQDSLNFAADAIARYLCQTPNNPSDEDIKKLEEQKKKVLEKLNNGDAETIDAATKTLAAASGVIVREEKENRELLRKGDANATQAVATIMAYKELNLPYGSPINELDTKTQIKFNNLVTKNTEKLATARNEQKRFSTGELAGRMAGTMQQAQTFEKRIRQHIGEKKLFGSVKAWLKKIDNNLTKHLGKPYTTAKKVIKPIAQFGTSLAVGFATMTALTAAGTALATTGTVGATVGAALIPAYMTYMTYKAGKSAIKAMKDPNATTAEKWAKGIGAAATASLSMIGIGGAVGQALGENSPAIAQCCSNVMSSLSGVTRGTIVAAANSMPNVVKGFILRKKLKKAKAEILDTKDPAKLHKLITSHSTLRREQYNNVMDGAGKAIGTVSASVIMTSSFAQDLRAEVVDTVTGNQTPSPVPTDTHGVKPPFIQEPTQSTNLFDINNPLTSNDGLTNAFALATDSIDATTPEAEFKPPYLNAEAQAAAEVENANPDDLHGAKLPENGLTDEQKAQNLAAAEEKGSGHIGKSDMESMQKDLNSHHGDKLGYTQEEKVSLMKAMAEGYGTESYEAVHAAMAEPRILAAQMGITAEVEASAQAAGINPNTDYSKALLNHLATHPELANNEGFKAYVAEHFDEQDRFHSSNYTVRTETHTTVHTTHQTQQPTPSPAPNNTSGFTLTPVDHLPGEQPTPQPAPQPIYHEPVMPHIPAHGIYAEHDYARVNGQEYHRSLEFSNKLGYTLNDRAILGVYQNNHNPDDFVMITAPLDHHGQPIPDGRLTASHHTYEYLRDAQEQAHTGYERQSYKMQYGGSYGYGTRVCHGTGVFGHTTVSSNDFGRQLGEYAAMRGTNIAMNAAEHALHHLVDKWTGGRRC